MMQSTSTSPQSPATLAVLGAGTWGLTLAGVLAENGHTVRCWDRDTPLLTLLAGGARHPKLEHYAIPAGIAFEHDLLRAVEGVDAVVLVIPSQAMRPVLAQLAAAGLHTRVPRWVIATKGIEQQTHLLMHEVLCATLGAEAGARAGVLSGPSHAEEVSRQMPTMLVATAADAALAQSIQQYFLRPCLRVYTHDDVCGVELGGSLKNVIAIAAGISDGMGFGDNTRAALMTRGLAEIVRLGLAAGARLETFMGLTGVGDLIVTASSKHSRNHRFGELLAQGLPCADALREVGMVVEGYPTALSALQLAATHGVELPISEAVHAICYEGLSPQAAVHDLLTRDLKPELSALQLDPARLK
jgi:glycerol-3-phosphate dehydrogenase (NAD(P)+)